MVRPVDAKAEQCGEGRFGSPKTLMGNRLDANFVPIDASYLREQAQKCVRLARDCPHQPTSHQLEVIGMELMEKAAEIDDLLSDSRRE